MSSQNGRVTGRHTFGRARQGIPIEICPIGYLTSANVVVVRYLGVSEVAERTGLSVNTIKAYSKIPGRMPQPDALTGRVQGWLPETIDRWMQKRGIRPELH